MSDTYHRARFPDAFPPAPTTFSPEATALVDSILALRMEPGTSDVFWLSGDAEALMDKRLKEFTPALDLIDRSMRSMLARRPEFIGQELAGDAAGWHGYEPVHRIGGETVIVFMTAAVGPVPTVVMHEDLYEGLLEQSFDEMYEPPEEE